VRLALFALAATIGCAAHAPNVPVPSPDPGALHARAVTAPKAGAVQPVALAITNGLDAPVRIDPRQVFALDDAGSRVAPLPAGEAARRAGGHVPGTLKRTAVGAATGGAIGAIGGVVGGAIQGGIGIGAAVGSAVGATFGAISGLLGGGGDDNAHAAEFQDRALPATTLANGMSATGYVYYPEGRYRSLELLTVGERGGETMRTTVPVE